MRALLDPVLQLLAPARCVACGVRAPLPWCRACEAAAARRRNRRPCPACGADLASAAPHRCWIGAAPVAGVVAAYDYRAPLPASVVAAKLGGAWAALPPLGRRLGAAVAGQTGAESLPLPDLVTWVPTEPGRVRARGVDHAALLAEGVAAVLGRPARALLAARPGMPDQGSRPRWRRHRPPAGAFRPRMPARTAAVLLVDDVLTTGATITAAAAVLRRAGAREVRAAVLARAGVHGLGTRAAAERPEAGAMVGRSEGGRMDIRIKGTNLDITSRIREHAEDKLAKVTRVFDRFIDMEVVFSEETNPRIADKIHCEVVLHAKGNYLRAAASAPDPIAAVDAAQQKLERQVRKLKTRIVDGNRNPMPPPKHARLTPTDNISEVGPVDADEDPA